MALDIVKHNWNGAEIRQRSTDGFVNLTDMCKAERRRVHDYLRLPQTEAYISALSNDTGILRENLVVKKEGKGGGTYAHPEIAIDCAQWVSMSFRIWAARTLRDVIANGAAKSLDRMLDIPSPWTQAFDSEMEAHISRVTGFHKNDIRNGKFYWEFVYGWMTPEEKAHLNEINPVLPNGRRKVKIHQCLAPETKIRLGPLQLKLLSKLESCNSVSELRRMRDRAKGVNQPSLFDGINFEALEAA
jgi:hypothetical protein